MSGFRRLPSSLLLALALLLGITACATRTPSPAPAAPVEDPAAAFPAQIQLPGQQPTTLTQQPKHIVSLSPTATETLYAVGAGQQVAAVDRDSDRPGSAPRTELDALTGDAGAIAVHKPDLVVAPEGADKLVQGLRALDVPVLVTPSPASLDEAFAQIETLGQATGHGRQARDVSGRMRSDIDRIVAGTPKPPRPLTYYHEISPDLYSASSQSFVGSIYTRFGMTSIADQAGEKFPRLSPEHVVQADPDLVLLADSKCCGANPQSVAARPGWDTLTAVRENRVVTLDDDVASRWGPRVVDLVRSVSGAVSRVPQR